MLVKGHSQDFLTESLGEFSANPFKGNLVNPEVSILCGTLGHCCLKKKKTKNKSSSKNPQEYLEIRQHLMFPFPNLIFTPSKGNTLLSLLFLTFAMVYFHFSGLESHWFRVVRQQKWVRDRGPHWKADSFREKWPHRATGPRSPRVNLLQIHHCNNQVHKLVLPAAV